MAQENSKIRRKFLGATRGLGLSKIGRELDESGLSPTESFAASEREKKAAAKRQGDLIRRQQSEEDLNLAIAEDQVGRGRLLARRGGRRSLIASR
jgi:hypothetical protein